MRTPGKSGRHRKGRARRGRDSGRSVRMRGWVVLLCTAACVGIAVLLIARSFLGSGAAPADPAERASLQTDESLTSTPKATPSTLQSSVRSGSASTESQPAPAEPAAAAGATGPWNTPLKSLTAEDLKKEAFDVVQQVMMDLPDSTDPLGMMGMLHDQFGDTAKAVKWWQATLARDPTHAYAYFAMARIALKNGEHEQTVELSRRARQISPKLPGVGQQLAEALLELGDPEEAAETLREELDDNPDSGGANYLLGQAYLQLKQYEQAIGHYRKALDAMPEDSRVCYGLAGAYGRLGQSDKAEQYREKFTQLRAREREASLARRRQATDVSWLAEIVAKTHTVAGKVYGGHRHFRKAEEHWRRAATLDANNAVSRQGLVELLMQSKREVEAAKICEQIREIQPENATCHLKLGLIRSQLRQFVAAEEALREAVRLAPDRPAGYRSLVEVLLQDDEKVSEAKALAEKLVKMEATAPNFMLLGKTCDRNGDAPGALAAMRRAAELDPRDEEIANAYRQLQKRP